MYLDTSVLVAYYCPEPLSTKVEILLRRQLSPIVSELTEVELNSAVALKVREQGLRQAEAFQVLTQFQQYLDDDLYTKLSLESRHFQLAKTWLSQLQWPLRSLDALHLAAAGISHSPLATADKLLAKAAQALGVNVLLVAPGSKSKT